MKSRLLPVLLLLFVCSGCAALIYEIVWFQLLELAIGVSAVSLGVLLGTFMGGMCLGSFLVPRLLPTRVHPLKVYAWLEIGIGLCGMLLLVLVPLIGGVYTAWAGGGMRGILVRAAAAAVCLLPPTLLMGATLPAIARGIEASPKGVAWLGFCYGGNTFGAVIGSLLAGFYLLRVYDVTIATGVAVVLNFGVAALALSIASRVPRDEPVAAGAAFTPAAAAPVAAGYAALIYVAVAMSGTTALAAQVVWTRILSLLIGATIYTFSLILAVFLAGLGLGSSIGAALAPTLKRPRLALAWCQLSLCAALGWAAYLLNGAFPFWPVNPAISTDLKYLFQIDLFRCALAVMPGALLWGATFPLALASITRADQDTGRLVGGLYAANTLGAIVGALTASTVLIALIGSQHTQQIIIGVAGLSGLLLLWGEKDNLAFGAGTALAALMAISVPPLPGMFVAYGRYAATYLGPGQPEIIYMGEGWNAAIAVSERPNGVRNYHNAGKVQASSEPQDMRLQRMLGHLTTLVPARAETVLVIGCGAGVTAGAVSLEPTLKQEIIAEIEPLVPIAARDYMGAHNFDVIRNPKVSIVLDDARHFLMTTDRKFDAITSDPLDPWVKGAAMLYTKEFWEEARRHLNPGGVVTVFVQLYESNLEAVKSEVATFFEAFPHGMIFANLHNGQGYDVVLLGQLEPTPINLDEVEARLNTPDYAAVKQSLADVGMYSAVDLFGTYAGQASDFKEWVKDAEINRDRNLRLQYLAGRGLNLYQADVIYRDMAIYGQEPADTFDGSDQMKQALLARIRMEQGGQ